MPVTIKFEVDTKNPLKSKTLERSRKMEDVDKVVLVAGKPFNEIFGESEIKKDKVIVDPIRKASGLKKLLESSVFRWRSIK